jgi:TonB family protein
MRLLMCVLVISASALSAFAATSPTISTQDVRFAVTVPSRTATPPQILRHTAPSYTREAYKQRIEGTVVLEAHFDEEGYFKILRVVKGLGHGLNENAIAVLSEWRFSPAMRDGERVSVVADIEVPFRLSDADEHERQRIQKLLDAHKALRDLVFKATHPPAETDTPQTPQ